MILYALCVGFLKNVLVCIRLCGEFVSLSPQSQVSVTMFATWGLTLPGAAY